MSAQLDAGTKLQLNPDLVVWPHGALRYGFMDADGTVDYSMSFEADALQVLKAFKQPVRIGDVFDRTTPKIFSILAEALQSKILILSDVNLLNVGHSRCDGFRLGDFEDRDLRCSLTRHVRLSGKSIFTIDGALHATEQLTCMRWMIGLPYRYHDIDSPETRQFRHWISAFSPAADYAEALPIIALLTRAGRECFRAPLLKVVRAHAYCVSDGDVQFTHSDYPGLAGITVLYFANTIWDRNWGSEMLFYGRSGEAEIAIEPRPGRILAFRGDLLHRAGVPSKIAEHPRYTLVVRLLSRPEAVPTSRRT